MVSHLWHYIIIKISILVIKIRILWENHKVWYLYDITLSNQYIHERMNEWMNENF